MKKDSFIASGRFGLRMGGMFVRFDRRSEEPPVGDERKSIGNQCDATPLFLADCFRQTGLETDGLSDTGGCFS